MLAEDLRPPKKASCSPHNGGRAKEIRKKRDKGIKMGPAPLGGSCEGGKFFFTCSETLSLVAKRVRFGISGKCNNRCVEGKLGRILHKDQCQLASPSLYHTCLHTCWDRWGLGAEAQALEVRPQREDWNCLP